MFVVAAALCGAAFSLGSKSSAVRQDASGIPPEHPVLLALHYQRELALTDEQVQKLNSLHDELATEFAPFREQAAAIQLGMRQVQNGQSNQETAAKLQQQAQELTAKIQPMFERYAQELGKLLTDEQRQKLSKFADEANGSRNGHPGNGHSGDGQDFVLNAMMQSREQLQITPQQFTKLQYLQANFIRAFAPLREKMELLQMEMQDKFGKTGKTPTAEYADKAADIQKEVAALQSQISDQAIKEVLEPKQRTKLEELLHGEHRPTPNAG
jgi:Spy/CpxP family protein refolding chaperone